MWYGKKENSIFEPSKGGMGIRLNVARTKFIKIMVDDIYKNDSPN